MIVGSKYCDDIDPDSFIRYNDLKYYPIFDNDEKVVYIQISNQKIPIRKYNGEYFVYIDNVVYNFKKPKRAFNQIDTIDRLTDNTSLDSALKGKKVKENENTKKRIAKIEKEIEKRIMKKMKKINKKSRKSKKINKSKRKSRKSKRKSKKSKRKTKDSNKKEYNTGDGEQKTDSTKQKSNDKINKMLKKLIKNWKS